MLIMGNIYYLLSARHFSKFFTKVNPFKEGIITVPIFTDEETEAHGDLDLVPDLRELRNFQFTNEKTGLKLRGLRTDLAGRMANKFLNST